MTYEQNTTTIDVPRLFSDLLVSESDLRSIDELEIPTNLGVTSMSELKTSTVKDTLHFLLPHRRFNILGVGAVSGVAEQPLGQTTVDGALNRLEDGRNRLSPFGTETAVWISIENGLFRYSPSEMKNLNTSPATKVIDTSVAFDPLVSYEDRAVTAILLPGHALVTEISPTSEAVLFPGEAVIAAYEADGGFAKHTAGSMLVRMGMVKNGKNPHAELTAGRKGGPLNRQDQIARVITRALLRLAHAEA